MIKNSEKSDLPLGWINITVDDAVINISTNGKKIRQKEYAEEGRYAVIDQGQEQVGGYTDDKDKVVVCQLPVIVFGDHTKVVKYVNHPFAAGADGIKVLQPHGFVESRYLEYCLRHISECMVSKGYARHYQHLAKSNFPLPPHSEQKRIVAKIEELFSELDKGIECFKTAREQLKVYRQALLKHAFEGKLTAAWREENQDKLETADALLKRIQTERADRYRQQVKEWEKAAKAWEKSGKNGSKPGKPSKPKELSPLTVEELAELPQLPEGWGWVKLGNLIDDPTYGTAKKCEYKSNGKGVLRIPNVVSGRIDASDLKFADFTGDEVEAYSLKSGDILMIRSNGSISIVGQCAIASGNDCEYLFAGYLIRLRPFQQLVSPSFLHKQLSSHMLRKQIEQKAKSTSGVNNINSGEIQSLILAFCPIEEQHQIVEELDSKLSALDQLDRTITTALQQAETLRQSILKKAFSGQLVPQDPNDEPVAALLARIKAERGGEAAPGSNLRTKKAGPPAGSPLQRPRKPRTRGTS